MKKFILFLLFSAVFSTLFSRVPQPLFHFKSNFSNTSLLSIDSVGESLFLEYHGDSATLTQGKINGYPAVKFDRAGFFTFQTSDLINADNALFLIVYEPKIEEFELEHGLWKLQNIYRSHFLTSINVGDAQKNVRYKYFFDKGTNVTTNFFHFEKNDSLQFSGTDTIFIGKVDSVFFDGKLAEFLIITEDISEVERHIWQSYLTLKYGVTMYKGNYLSASGDTLWHFLQNETYAFGVGGIGRDDSIGFCQNFSTIYGDSVKISLHNYIDNQQQTSQTPFQNGEYVFWGHNENGFEIGSAIFPIGDNFYNFFQRKWRVKPIVNNSYMLDFQINTPQNYNSQNLRLFVAKDENFTSFATQVYFPENIDNQRITFKNIEIPQTSDTVFYFTFGYGVNTLTDINNADNQQDNTLQNPIYSVFTEADWQPNPVVENLYVWYRLTRSATVWFSVHSNGTIPLCQTPPQNLQAGENQTIIPMSMLPTGTYSVYVHVDDMAVMQTIIKR